MNLRLVGGMAIATTAIVLAVLPIVLAADSSYSEYPPPPPTPISPTDWEGPLTPYIGDVNFDERVTMADVLAIMGHRAGVAMLSESQLAVADTNGDLQVTMADGLHIMQFRADPYRTLGILSKPLWEWPNDAGLSDPLGQNAG